MPIVLRAAASNWLVDRRPMRIWRERVGVIARAALVAIGAVAGVTASNGSHAQSAEPPQQPVMRIEAGGHTAPIRRLAVDATGDILASVSDDKTLRLWNLPEGTLRLVIRPPIGPGAEGELAAVAMAPDGGRVIAAGHTARSWDGAFAIYVFDTASGRLLARLPGLPAPVAHLAFSADGGRFAAALGGRAGIKVWDARSGQIVFEDSAYAGPARMVAFDSAGRLATTASDGLVRIYDQDGRLRIKRAPLEGARPYGLAWSPDGALLAIGYEDRLRVDLLAAADLRGVFAPDVTGLDGEGLPAITWAADGRGGVQLLAAGYATQARTTAPELGYVVRRWADFGLGPARDIQAARDAITHLLALPRGGAVYAAADPGWGRIGADGTAEQVPQSPGANLRATRATLAIAEDGGAVRFALEAAQPPLLFDPRHGALTAWDGRAGFMGARTGSGRLRVEDWRDTNRPRLGATPLPLGSGEFARSLALLPRDDGFLLGTDTHLRLFDATGRPIAALATPGAVWAIAVAGSRVVATLGDGTIRWYRIGNRTLAEDAALFVHAQTRRWVLWTPDGLFDHGADGGQELVGLHLNRTRNQTPEWASFQQAYRTLYAPAALRAVLAGDPEPARARLVALGDVRGRIGRLPRLTMRSVCALRADASCLPFDPSQRLLPDGATALRFEIEAVDHGLGLGPLDILVNDRIAFRGTVRPGISQFDVPLDTGGNRLALRLYSEDRGLFASGPTLLLRRAGQPEPPRGAGRLVILAIGVDTYRLPNMALRFAVADAETVARTLRGQAAGLFTDTQVTVLRNAEATRRGILDALANAARETEAGDTFVLYLAGHGVRSEPDQRFLFLPQDVTDMSAWPALRAQAIDDTTLVAALARIRARDALLLLDTCHAGQLTLDQLAALSNETGRLLLAASSSVQEALDSYDERNGVFAYALREGLMGRAAIDQEGRVSALALGEWTMRRVPELAREKNHSQNAVFRTAQRDLRAFPLALAPQRR